jgi:hypothetical protein
MGSGSDIILWSPVIENAYLKIDRAEYFKNLLATTSMHEKTKMVKGMKLMGMTTRNEYTVVNCKFSKRKSRLYAMEISNLKGCNYVQYNARDLYAPVLKPLPSGDFWRR